MIKFSLECTEEDYCRLYVRIGPNRMIVFSGGEFVNDLYLAYKAALEIIYSAAEDIAIEVDEILQDFMAAWLEDNEVEKPVEINLDTFLMAALNA